MHLAVIDAVFGGGRGDDETDPPLQMRPRAQRRRAFRSSRCRRENHQAGERVSRLLRKRGVICDYRGASELNSTMLIRVPNDHRAGVTRFPKIRLPSLLTLRLETS